MTAPTVFLVDDDAAVRDSVSMLLDTAGYRVETFESGEAFLGSGRLDDPGCVILDLRMDGMSGLDVQAALGAEGSKLPVITTSTPRGRCWSGTRSRPRPSSRPCATA